MTRSSARLRSHQDAYFFDYPQLLSSSTRRLLDRVLWLLAGKRGFELLPFSLIVSQDCESVRDRLSRRSSITGPSAMPKLVRGEVLVHDGIHWQFHVIGDLLRRSSAWEARFNLRSDGDATVIDGDFGVSEHQRLSIAIFRAISYAGMCTFLATLVSSSWHLILRVGLPSLVCSLLILVIARLNLVRAATLRESRMTECLDVVRSLIEAQPKD